MVDQLSGMTAQAAPGPPGNAIPASAPAHENPSHLLRVASPLFPRNWRVRWRLLALVIIPTVAAIVLGVLRIQSARDTAATFARVHQLAVLGADVTALAESVEDERDLTAGYITSGRSGALLGPLNSQYAITNARAAAVQDLSPQIGSAYPAVIRTDLGLAQNRIEALPDLRILAHSQISALPMITDYSQVVATLLAFDDQIATNSSNARLAETVISFGSLAQMEEDTSQQRGILYAALIQRQFGLGGLAALQSEQSSQASDLAAFDAEGASLPAFGVSGQLTEVQQFNDVVAGPDVDAAESIEQQALIKGGTGPALDGDPQSWYTDMSGTLADMRAVESDELASITAQSDSLQQGASSSVQTTGIFVLALLLVVMLAAIGIARSMIVPLRRLRADALDVASRRLPEVVRRLSEGQATGENIAIEPVGIGSTDEIGEVATAFDQVHREAVRLAGDEALLRATLNAMFVNLSRRSQSLIERQLTIIDSLEQSEQDPDRLSSLFRLDHLATRMRRNSENLLVLAGQDVTRRWNQPVALVDVVRAAVSEIEHYDRVMLNVQPGVMIAGRAVSDLVHLMAELAENATTFSPSETQVYVTGQALSSGGVLLEITDSGLGIAESELAHINWRLDNPPVVDVAVSRRMGLFVVGRLAGRHGVRIRLQQATGGGVTALIWVPDGVAERAEAPPLGTLRRRFDADGYGPQIQEPSRGPRRQPSPAAPPAGWGPESPPPRPFVPSLGSVPPPDFTRPAPAPPQAPTPASAAPQAPLPAAAPEVRNSMDPFAAVPEMDPFAAVPQSAVPQSAVPEIAEAAGGGASAQEAPPWEAGQRAGAGPDQRLPIYDSVESEWFRRSGKVFSGEQPRQPVTSSWSSPADAGWQAAEVVVAPTAGDVTGVGLPRRVPKANLVPGSIGGAEQGKPAAEQDPPPLRSPDAARERMAKFQRGLREGRTAAPREPWDG
jgi:signal transduction histidine kinase